MHELSIATALVKAVTRAASDNGATRVTSVRVRVGSLSCLNEESLRFGFEAVAKDTAAEGCALEVSKPPAAGTCTSCGWRGEVRDSWVPACPECGTYPVAVQGTDELTLESITIP
jgi:hydrogenase nickel incorporation protein HypA/HybF